MIINIQKTYLNKILEYKKEEIIGTNPLSYSHPGDVEKMEDAFLNIINIVFKLNYI